MDGIHGELTKNFGSELTRMLSSAKLIPAQAEQIWGVPAAHIQSVMDGKETPSEELEKAIEGHAPLYLGDLYTSEARRGIKVYDDTKDGALVFHAKNSDKTRRSLYRTERDGVKFSIYDYADTAVSRVSESTIIPERIWENLIVENDFAQNMPRWASNKGHFEQQMTFFLGDITTYYTDREGKVFAENMQTGDMEWHTPFVPHLFTKRDEKEALILAVTYRGEFGTRKFLDEINAMSEEEYVSKIGETLSGIDVKDLKTNEVGYLVNRNDKKEFIEDGAYKTRIILEGVPFQDDTLGIEYKFSSGDDKLDIEVPSERWGYVIGENLVEFMWGGNKETLDPGSSFFVKKNIPHALRCPKGEGSVVVMQVQPQQEDPWKTLALTLHYAGHEGVQRARRETKQWTK